MYLSVSGRPLYCISAVRAGMPTAAYTPLPWMGERRTIRRRIIAYLSRANAYDAALPHRCTEETSMKHAMLGLCLCAMGPGACAAQRFTRDSPQRSANAPIAMAHVYTR